MEYRQRKLKFLGATPRINGNTEVFLCFEAGPSQCTNDTALEKQMWRHWYNFWKHVALPTNTRSHTCTTQHDMSIGHFLPCHGQIPIMAGMAPVVKTFEGIQPHSQCDQPIGSTPAKFTGSQVSFLDPHRCQHTKHLVLHLATIFSATDWSLVPLLASKATIKPSYCRFEASSSVSAS